mmetsp:Transcript_22505/g.76505  ORF Transcript_22505/g.76505 Transcript_22505/m.76505 type:complete len:400 (-) Transcript_22505:273-1472(-)
MPSTADADRCSDVSRLCVLCAAPAACVWWHVTDAGALAQLRWAAAFAVGALCLTIRLIPVGMRVLLKKGLFGMDLNKKGTTAGLVKVPEALGLVPGVVYLVATMVFQLVAFGSGAAASGGLPPEWLPEYNAALASVTFMLFLGFVDDVLDLPWRVKLLLPAFAALPLVVAYDGGTTVVLPRAAASVLGHATLTLGPLYSLYMFLLAVFCTNSINIFAGINGLEAGQTLVVAAAVLLLNLTRLAGDPPPEVRDPHLFSATLMLPLAGVTAGLLAFNWYPSKVFVGDTFTYFAGMALAVSGILGHFSETLLLFFLPQVFNFVYSVPQLLKIVPCPRHRLPMFDASTGTLAPTPNLNLVNLALRLFGNRTERSLCNHLLGLQALCCAAVFALRIALAGIYKA